MPPCPLVIALVPLKCSSRNIQFPHRVPFTREKMPWCPHRFKNEAQVCMLSVSFLSYLESYLLITYLFKLRFKVMAQRCNFKLPFHVTMLSSRCKLLFKVTCRGCPCKLPFKVTMVEVPFRISFVRYLPFTNYI